MSGEDEGILRATLRSGGSLVAVILSGGSLQASVRYTDRVSVPPYEGTYVVRPTLSLQVMPTKGKEMTDDVTVEGIPIESVSNTAGGNTVIIG